MPIKTTGVNASVPINSAPDGAMFDRSHASKLFVGGNYALSPKYSFLYHVRFELDDTLSIVRDSQKLRETGMLVKSVNLPKFTVENKTLNSYNRPNIVQTKVKYDSVTVTFHDDSADVVLNFWRDYYGYYYRDSDYYPNSDGNPELYQFEYKYASNPFLDDKTWGYTLRGQNASRRYFIKNMRIYSLHQGEFTEYMLINPTITGFQHGQHTASEGGSTLEHTMTLSYESVMYFTGGVTESTVPGMLDLHYDKRPSSISPRQTNVTRGTATGGDGVIGALNGTNARRPRPFGARSVLGPGGILETSDAVLGDLKSGNLGGAFLKGLKSYRNNKNANLKGLLLTDVSKAVLKGILTNQNPFSDVQVPFLSSVKDGLEQAQSKKKLNKEADGWKSYYGNTGSGGKEQAAKETSAYTGNYSYGPPNTSSTPVPGTNGGPTSIFSQAGPNNNVSSNGNDVSSSGVTTQSAPTPYIETSSTGARQDDSRDARDTGYGTAANPAAGDNGFRIPATAPGMPRDSSNDVNSDQPSIQTGATAPRGQAASSYAGNHLTTMNNPSASDPSPDASPTTTNQSNPLNIQGGSSRVFSDPTGGNPQASRSRTPPRPEDTPA
jgi:hypothetical protein